MVLATDSYMSDNSTLQAGVAMATPAYFIEEGE